MSESRRVDETGRLIEIQEAFGWRGSESVVPGETQRSLRNMEEIVGAMSEPEPIEPEFLDRLMETVDDVLRKEARADLPWGIAFAVFAGILVWASIKIHPYPSAPIAPIAPVLAALLVGGLGAWWAWRRGQLS